MTLGSHRRMRFDFFFFVGTPRRWWKFETKFRTGVSHSDNGVLESSFPSVTAPT